ncbi:hypothetical protein BG015_009062 [Linnemannia schmuckeri]|uniref:Translation initiation factor eIF4e n=1 Tax=Linnemannia schmuckeri TaxID=64567 RepID=A0A9P5RW18_9FUNG|nr:hypothetical protein BG015_009062 [Linnemannia schmuckeri]
MSSHTSNTAVASGNSDNSKPAPGPWRPASLAGRNSPAPSNNNNSPLSTRDHSSTMDSSLSSHTTSSGMTPLRAVGGLTGGDRPRVQPTSSSSSAYQSSGSSAGAWIASSRRVPSAGQDRTYSEQSLSVSSSPILGSSGTFVRQASMTMNSISLSTTSSGLGNSTASGTHSTSGNTSGGNGVNNSGTGPVSSSSLSSTSVPKQPLNMEALAAKFADSKEAKEKFAALQLSPALVPAGTPDKERRNPMNAFAPPSSTSGNPHVAHIKVQRTASLTHSSQSNLVPKGKCSAPLLLYFSILMATLRPSNKLQPGLHAQSTDMRRTASHNNAFSSGLGVPVSVGASTGHINGSTHNGAPHTDGSNGPIQTTTTNGLSSPILAPFSLGQMNRSTSLRRSSLNPQDPGAPHHQDYASPSQTSALSSSMADKHPLQHPWTLYYDTTAGYNRQGSSLHIYENGLRDMGTFTTVEQFARYFNWIEKPHKIENSANYHLFKDGIKPMWEDPANASGGRWIVTLLTKNPELLDRCWMELAYALVGEQLDLGDDICGADAKSSGLLKSYITLETIRKELAREAEPSSTHTPTGNEATPSLTIDSVSVTPASVTEVSPATPGLSQGSSTQEKESGEGTSTAVETSGLLISVDGKGVLTA